MGVQYNTIDNVPVASFETSWKNESANQLIKSVVAEITPTQDLHGYDYPWPAGGGKNIFDYTRLQSGDGLTVTISQTGTVSISGLPTRETVFLCRYDITDLLQDGTYTLSQSQFFGAQLYSEVLSRNKDGTISYYGCANVLSKNIPVDKSLVDAYEICVVARKSTWGEESKTLSCTFQFEKGSTATTFTPYSNICPITGRTEATVWRTGKNLFNYTTAQSGRGIIASVSNDGVVTVSGIPNGTVAFVNNINITDLLKDGATYTISQSPIIGPEIYMEIMAEKSEGGNAYLANTASEGTAKTFVVDKSQYTKFYVYCVARAAYWGEESRTLSCTFQLEKGFPATPFAPYSGTSYPVSWQTEAGTVYGGTVDVVSGSLTVEWATTDLGLYTWNYSESAGAFYCGISTMKYYSSQTPIISALCSAYPNVGKPYLELGDKQLTTNMYGFSNSQKYCIIKDSAYTDAAEFKAAMSGVQLVYELATPQTYQLSGQQIIKTILGVNNVWADSGNIKKLMWQYTIFDLLRVFINGFEITDFIAFGGWQRDRNDVDGSEAGRTLDARMHRARVATKMRYNVTCRPLLVEELSSLERLIMPEYVTVKVIGDPFYGTWEKTCYVNNTSATYLIRKRNGAQWWSGITFPIIEV